MVMAIVALGMTGRSVNIAFVVAAIFTIFTTIPSVLVSSVIRLKGGFYTQAAVFVNETYAGWYQFIQLLAAVSIAMFAVGLSSYVGQLVPFVAENSFVFSMIFLTAFFILNCFGTEWMAKVQSFMFYFLVGALLMFTIVGIPQVHWSGYFGNELFGQPLFTNGAGGLLEAAAYLTFATAGATVILSLSAEAKNPKKDFPPVIIFSTLAIAVLYAFMATVIGGVLPSDQVIAAGNLGPVAYEILPLPLYYFFMIGGAVFALGTTLNSSIASRLRPMATATADGWFPDWLGKLHPKTRVPYGFLGVLFVVNVAVMIFKLDTGTIGKWSLIIGNVTGMVTALSVMRLPTLFPEAWKNSPFYMPKGALVAALSCTAFSLGVQAYLNLRGLTPAIIATNIVTAIVAYIWVTYRKKAGKVHMVASYEMD